VFNIGSDEEVSIRELADRVRELTGSASEVQLIPYEEAYEPGFEDMARRIPDLTKVRDTLGWAPTKCLDEILEDVVANQRAPAPV
jgi:UDP-glucose 4-epimerase